MKKKQAATPKKTEAPSDFDDIMGALLKVPQKRKKKKPKKKVKKPESDEAE